jgi:pimeloyl-ACP methyl ester carboxylesterase
MKGPTMETLQLRQMQACYLDTGSGTPVILVHCSSGSHKQWSFLEERLADSYRVLAPDLLGYGQSSAWPQSGAAPADSDLDVVMALIEEAGRPVHLIGHSYGGAICLDAARHHAERGSGAVASLLLVEPVAFHLLRDSRRQREWRTISAVARKCIERSARGRPKQAANAYMGFWLGPLKWRLSPRRFRQEVVRTVHKVAHEFRGVFAHGTTADDFRSIECPVTLVCGGRSPRPAAAVVDILWETLSRADVQRIPAAGHMSPFTHKREVAALVLAHLARTDSTVAAAG